MPEKNDFPEEAREKVAKAILEAHRKIEIEKIESVPFDKDFYTEVIKEIATSIPEMVVIRGWALISSQVNLSVRRHIASGSNKEIKDFFEGVGPLSTDAGKIRLAKLLGWIPEDVFKSLNILRKMRNGLAHNVYTSREASAKINVDRRDFEFVNNAIFSAATVLKDLGRSDESPEDSIERLSNTDYLRIAFILTATTVFECILNGPGLKAISGNTRIEPLYNYDEAPEWAKELRLVTAQGILLIME